MNEIKIGDKYINTHHPEKGIRIATEETIKSIKFAKAFNWGTCYLQRID